MRQLFISLFDRTTSPPSASPYHPRTAYKITASSSRNPYRSFDPADDLQALQPISHQLISHQIISHQDEDSKGAHTVSMAYPGRIGEKGGGGRRAGEGEGGSEESVGGRGRRGDIMRTTEVDVQYQDRNGRRDAGAMV